MSNTAITAQFIVAITVIAVAYDVWIKLRQPDGDATISWVMRTASKRWMIVGVAWGVLTGHLFWPNCPTCPPTPAEIHGVP